MMPHTRDLLRRWPRTLPPRNAQEPGRFQPLLCGRLAELSTNESADPSTESRCFLLVFGLRENPDQRFCSRWADEHPGPSVQLVVDLLDLRHQVVRELPDLHLQVLLD